MARWLLGPTEINLYVPSQNPGKLYAFRIGTDGSLWAVPRSPYPLPDLPISAAATPDGQLAYVTDGGLLQSGSRRVSAFTIRADGPLRTIGDLQAGESPVGILPSPDGRHLYVSNIDSDDVSAFAIAIAIALNEIPGSPFSLDGGLQPALQALAITP